MMSNTGGGHRASAEAIKAAFQEKYGDEYEVGPQCVCLERGWACCEVQTSQGQFLRRKERRCRCISAWPAWCLSYHLVLSHALLNNKAPFVTADPD